MLLELALLVAAILVIGGLFVLMRAQKPVTSIQQEIQRHRYAEAIAEADRQLARNARDGATQLHRAEALKLLGRFDEAIASYRQSDDPAAAEGIALSLAHLRRDLDEARRIMETTIAIHPQIQEFQALGLAWILLRRGDRELALRLFDDNLVLLQTRFKDDYTDPDPLLAETLWMFAALSDAAGDPDRARTLFAQAAAWAPGSVWANSNAV